MCVCICLPPAIVSQTLIVLLLAASTVCFILFTLSFPAPGMQRVSHRVTAVVIKSQIDKSETAVLRG